MASSIPLLDVFSHRTFHVSRTVPLEEVKRLVGRDSIDHLLEEGTTDVVPPVGGSFRLQPGAKYSVPPPPYVEVSNKVFKKRFELHNGRVLVDQVEKAFGMSKLRLTLEGGRSVGLDRGDEGFSTESFAPGADLTIGSGDPTTSPRERTTQKGSTSEKSAGPTWRERHFVLTPQRFCFPDGERLIEVPLAQISLVVHNPKEDPRIFRLWTSVPPSDRESPVIELRAASVAGAAKWVELLHQAAECARLQKAVEDSKRREKPLHVEINGTRITTKKKGKK